MTTKLIDSLSSKTSSPFNQQKNLLNNYSSYQILEFQTTQNGNQIIESTVLDYPTHLSDFYLRYTYQDFDGNGIGRHQRPELYNLFGSLYFFNSFQVKINNVIVNHDANLAAHNGLFINNEDSDNNQYGIRNYQHMLSTIQGQANYSQMDVIASGPRLSQWYINPTALTNNFKYVHVPFKYLSNLFNQDGYLPAGTLIEITFQVEQNDTLYNPKGANITYNAATITLTSGQQAVRISNNDISAYYVNRKLKKNLFQYASNKFSVYYQDLILADTQNFTYDPQAAYPGEPLISYTYTQEFNVMPSFIFLAICNGKFSNYQETIFDTHQGISRSFTGVRNGLIYGNQCIFIDNTNSNFTSKLSLEHALFYFKSFRVFINDNEIINYNQDDHKIDFDEFLYEINNIFVAKENEVHPPLNSAYQQTPYKINLSNNTASNFSDVLLSSGVLTIQYVVAPQRNSLYTTSTTAGPFTDYSVAMLISEKRQFTINETRKTTKI
jgi:hypothetical protein